MLVVCAYRIQKDVLSIHFIGQHCKLIVTIMSYFDLDILATTGVQKYEGWRSKSPAKLAKSRDLGAVSAYCRRIAFVRISAGFGVTVSK